tara:strand:+ start:22950 stop:23750 length:801 start_codon:yes stop_codon:yes gene_type:complete
MKIDIIIQGGIWPATVSAAHSYVNHPMVDRVIVSTWDSESVTEANIKDERVVLLKNKFPDYEGPGNLNLHLISSRNGLKQCTNEVVLKIRSDEIMSPEGLTTWINYFKEHDNKDTLRCLDGTTQRSKIAVIATNINYPYHPQDHVFIGYKEDLFKLFNMPLSYEPPLMPEPVDFSTKTGHLRNPIYIGANYFALFFQDSQHHLENWKEYLLDGAPKRQEALDFYLKHRNSIFRPLPRIKMWWQKFNCEYWWDGYYNGGDRYAGEDE